MTNYRSINAQEENVKNYHSEIFRGCRHPHDGFPNGGRSFFARIFGMTNRISKQCGDDGDDNVAQKRIPFFEKRCHVSVGALLLVVVVFAVGTSCSGFIAGFYSAGKSRTSFERNDDEGTTFYYGTEDEEENDLILRSDGGRMQQYPFLAQRSHQELRGDDSDPPPPFKRRSSSPQKGNQNLISFPFGGSTTTTTTPRPIIYLNNRDAYQLLLDTTGGLTVTSAISQYSWDYFLLSSGLDAQLNKAYCATATVAALINSLRFLHSGSAVFNNNNNIPIDAMYAPYPYATQVDVFNSCTERTVVSHTGGGFGVDGVLTPPYGLGMDQVSQLLSCLLNDGPDTTSNNGWSIELHHLDETHVTVSKMRFDLKSALSDPEARVIVNYHRAHVGQVGGGHWSSIGSYSVNGDMFLLLDVAKYRYPPVWIPTERLFESMATWDECGIWDYPMAQDNLTPEERMAGYQTTPPLTENNNNNNRSSTPSLVVVDDEFKATISKVLGCQKALRGYIIVRKN